MMDTVLPHGVDSCSELAGGDRLIGQKTVSSGSPGHRHRDHYHGHHHFSPSHRSVQLPTPYVHERKMRREIANHNERKRMQSINAGFQSLRVLLPRNGKSSSVDRLSKAAILQQAVDYISFLMQERQQLLELNRQCMTASMCLSTALTSNSGGNSKQCSFSPIPLIKRHKSSSDEESSDKPLKTVSADADIATVPASAQYVPGSEIAVIRDRLKRRLPSQELTVDCTNSEMVAKSLDAKCCVKEEIAVTSSDDPIPDHHVVSSTTVFPALMMQNDKTEQNSGCISPSVSRRNLTTILQAIQYLEGKSFYSDDISSIQSSTDSDRDSDRDSDTVPNSQISSMYDNAFEPFGMMTAAATMSSVKNSMSLLRTELFQPLAPVNRC